MLMLQESTEPHVKGDIDTTYHTQQRDMFTSGLAAEIGVNAFAVWHAIKSHADFQTGVAWPGVRRLMLLTGLSTDPVQAAIKKLVEHHLLRVSKRGQKNIYVARERLNVRVGRMVICTVVVDFVPATMRERLARIKNATAANSEGSDVWAEVELIPGPGLKLDVSSGTFKTNIRADEIPDQLTQATAAGQLTTPAAARQHLRDLAQRMRVKCAATANQRAPKK